MEFSVQAKPQKGDETGFIGDPLRHWGNDDLMLRKSTRDEIERDRPLAFRVLNWPAMRALFEEIDKESKAAKARVRSFGVRAVLIAATGLTLAALGTWLAPDWSELAQLMGILAALLLVLGTGMGLMQFLNGRRRIAWLHSRMKAERLRQLHFQLLIGNLPLVVRAMNDDGAFDELVELRKKALMRYQDRFIATPKPEFEKILADLAYEDVWHSDSWGASQPSATELGPTKEVDELLEALLRLRFGVQRYYTTLSLADHTASATFRMRMLHVCADCLTVLLLISSLALAVVIFLGFAEIERAAIAIAAAAAAGVAALRTIEEGLRYSDDTRRLKWYLAAINVVERRYPRLQFPGRVRLHRELETLAYREMRDFLVTHHDARFVLQ